jgi:hypothetical protein
MNNMLKEFEELLLDNTLLKVQNHALETKNPKWKEWWQNHSRVHKRTDSRKHGISSL